MAQQSQKPEGLTVVKNEPIESIDIDSKKEEEVSKTGEDKEPIKESAETKDAPEHEIERSTLDSKHETKDILSSDSKAEKTNEDEEDEGAPPQRPPRPVSPLTRVTNDLKEAFPAIEEKYITAMLIASQGNVDPAFNGLLYLSDPSVGVELPTSTSFTSLTATTKEKTRNPSITDDELLARKLQKEFEEEERRRRRRQQEKRRNLHNRARPTEEGDYDSPDEMEQIKESFTQGIEEARTTLNGWVSGIAKKFQENGSQQPQNNQNPKLFGALGGSSFNTSKGRSERFDDDPEIISNDFHNKISLTNKDTDDEPPTLPSRGRATPGDSDKPLPNQPSNEKKWQPLSADTPVNSDAFLVTDSEDEESGNDANKKSSVL
ncbi:uncharacterized protein PRCAT00002135001 [Priceomyces carsonii]|uniref:uncharacterized protein n=1 Tax=Priceomyces carsonii TaxID=28549 RepID=UPI002EDA38AE|nr:unnamed protein product [Priceomyces carsonii]